jgi:diaminopimelate decarboxylase
MSKLLFCYRDNHLHFGTTDLQQWVQKSTYKSPVILYSKRVLKERLALMQAWPRLHRLHFAMKANYNRDVLAVLKASGCGLDVVSWGEVALALEVGFTPADIIFSGVGKTRRELELAVAHNIFQINVESLAELERLREVCRNQNKSVAVGLRLNPKVDAGTHPHIATALKDSKFGLPLSQLEQCRQYFASDSHLQLRALSFHLGSQIVDTARFAEALKKIKPHFEVLQKQFPSLTRLDLGGGLGIDYHQHDLKQDEDRWLSMTRVYDEELRDLKAEIYLEMGRFLVARSGVMLGQVQYIKEFEDSHSEKSLAILDVGMNNLLRPSLYQAYHHLYPLLKKANRQRYMVVGPICESSDVFHKNIETTELRQDDIVAFADVGAYVQSMASDYNLQPRAQEILLHDI